MINQMADMQSRLDGYKRNNQWYGGNGNGNGYNNGNCNNNNNRNEGIILITTDTAVEVATTVAGAAVGERLEEAGAVVTRTATEADKASRPPRDVTTGPTGMDPTRAWHATTVLTDTRQMPPSQTWKVAHLRDAPDTEGMMQ